MAKRKQTGALEGEAKVMTEAKAIDERWRVARAAYEHANSLAVQAVGKYIEVGLHLAGIRQQYPGDLEFGRARKEWFPEMSKSWCSRLMKVAQDPRLHTEELAGLSISHLVELSSKDDETIQQIEDRVAQGDAPSVRSLREAPSEPVPSSDDGPAPGVPGTDAAPEETPSGPPDDGPDDPDGPWAPGWESRSGVDKDGFEWEAPPEIERPPRESMEKQIQDALQLSVRERIEFVRERPWGSPDSWIILGLSPFVDSLPNMELIEVVAEYWKDNEDDPHVCAVIDDAMQSVLQEYDDE